MQVSHFRPTQHAVFYIAQLRKTKATVDTGKPKEYNHLRQKAKKHQVNLSDGLWRCNFVCLGCKLPVEILDLE